MNFLDLGQSRTEQLKKDFDDISLKILLYTDDSRNLSTQLEEARFLFSEKSNVLRDMESKIASIERDYSVSEDSLENWRNQDIMYRDRLIELKDSLNKIKVNLTEAEQTNCILLKNLKKHNYLLLVETSSKNGYINHLKSEEEARNQLEHTILTEIENAEKYENDNAEQNMKNKILITKVEALKSQRNDVYYFSPSFFI